jgi:hypothetical protein
VYTINDESSHLIVQNVPSIGLERELKKMFTKVGAVEKINRIDGYPPKEVFTETYYIKYKTLKEAKYVDDDICNAIVSIITMFSLIIIFSHFYIGKQKRDWTIVHFMVRCCTSVMLQKWNRWRRLG